jgi:hypothetical protein
MARTPRPPLGAELINGGAAQDSPQPPDPATSNGHFPPVNHFLPAAAPLSAPGSGSPPPPVAGERVYQVTCRACSQRWTELEAEGLRAGKHHRCDSYQGDEAWRYASTIVARPVRHVPLDRPHKHTDACSKSLNHICHCECGGRQHGVRNLPLTEMPFTQLTLVELYDRLENPHPLDRR